MTFTIFNCALFTFSEKVNHWNLDVIVYWVIGAGCWIEKDLELSPNLQIGQKIPENCCLCLYLSVDQVSWLNELSFKRYIKKYILPHSNTDHDVTDLGNHGIVKNTRTWISWEWNINFRRNKKILSQYQGSESPWKTWKKCQFLRKLRKSLENSGKMFLKLEDSGKTFLTQGIFFGKFDFFYMSKSHLSEICTTSNISGKSLLFEHLNTIIIIIFVFAVLNKIKF